MPKQLTPAAWCKTVQFNEHGWNPALQSLEIARRGDRNLHLSLSKLFGIKRFSHNREENGC